MYLYFIVVFSAVYVKNKLCLHVMWATVLVVYFIKFVYTVRLEGSYFLTGDNF